jgi:hypothetical protein
MKKISVALMIIVVFLVGCVSFEIGNTEKELVAKITARHIGFEVQKQYPDIAREVLALSKGVLVAEAEETIDVILDRIVFVLTDEIKDDLIAMDVRDLVSLIKITPDVEITKSQMAIAKVVAKGLIEGIESQKFEKGE